MASSIGVSGVPADAALRSTIFRVVDATRKRRKMIKASTLDELMQKAKEKLYISDDVRVVTERDGFEVDEDEILRDLDNNESLLILPEGEDWTPVVATMQLLMSQNQQASSSKLELLSTTNPYQLNNRASSSITPETGAEASEVLPPNRSSYDNNEVNTAEAPLQNDFSGFAPTEQASFASQNQLSTLSAEGHNNPPEEDEIRLVLVGKTGAGKSATGNTIIGEKRFQASARGISTNIGCYHERVVRFGKNLLVIDTPGVFDTSKPQEEIAAEVSKFLIVSAPGPHAIILVTSAARRFTAEEVDCVRRLKDMFGEGLARYLFLVITRTEDWEDDDITCESFLSDLPQEAKFVLKECIEAKRVVAFQNSLRGENGEQQVRDLLTMLSDHMKVNEGRYYSEKNWEDAERAVQERIKQIMEAEMEEERKKTAQLEQEINEKIRREMNEKLQQMNDQQQRENDAWEQNFREVQDAMQREMEDMIKEESERLEHIGREGKNNQEQGERQKTETGHGPPSKTSRIIGADKEPVTTSGHFHDGASPATLNTERQNLSNQADTSPLTDGAAVLQEMSYQRRQENQQAERMMKEFRREARKLRASTMAQQEMNRVLQEKMEESKQFLLESFRQERAERERMYKTEIDNVKRDFQRQRKEDESKLHRLLEDKARNQARKEATLGPLFSHLTTRCVVM